MATITVTVASASTQEQRAAAWALAQENAARQVNGLAPLANVKALLESIINTRLLPEWIAGEAASHEAQQGILDLWKNATDAQRAAAKADLGG